MQKDKIISKLKEVFLKEDFFFIYDGAEVLGEEGLDMYIDGIQIDKIVFPKSIITQPFIETPDGTTFDLKDFSDSGLSDLLNSIESWQW